jgi:protein SCO1/2
MRRLLLALTIAFALCGVILILAVMTQAPRAARRSADNIASLTFQPHPGARLPLGETLVDESGRAVELGAYFTNAPVILVLEYLRCTSLCGVTLRSLVGDTLKRLPLEAGRDYQLVAISIDPRDRPDDAANAAITYGALLGRIDSKNGLHFLTGAPAAVRRIADSVGFPYRYDFLVDAYIHPAGFVVAAPDGVISRYVEGFATSSSDLIAAFADARQNRSQGPLARLLVLCQVHGASLGGWTAPIVAAFTVVEIGAALAAFAIFVAIRRRRFG